MRPTAYHLQQRLCVVADATALADGLEEMQQRVRMFVVGVSMGACVEDLALDLVAFGDQARRMADDFDRWNGKLRSKAGRDG